MAKNTGMNANDDKAGKATGLTASQSKALNKHLKDEENEPAPTKTVEAVNKARKKR